MLPNQSPRIARILVMALLLVAAAGAARAGPRQLVESSRVQRLTPQEVLEILLSGEGPVIIDCRNSGQYAEGHIPGAINVFHKDTWGRLKELRRLERERGIVYYDLKGVQSRVASGAVLAEGFRKVGVMEGHFSEWQRLGYPIAQGAAE